MNGLRVILRAGAVCGWLAVACSLRAAGILEELSPSQQADLKKGAQILVVEEIAGKPWPKVKIYRVIEATPEEVVAVFSDYTGAKSFVPKLLKSEISKQISPCVAEVDYGVDVPILPDEYYTVRNSVKFLPPDRYRVEWKLVRAVQTKDSEGMLTVEPYEGKSLMSYHNLVTPGSSMAVLLRGKAIEQMRQTVEAIGCEVEKQKTSNPAGLSRQVAALRAALGQ
ncbi:MAG TPA: hypothetical protein PLS03_07215 [Terrimicrobiaceae bacterium]|nr:hypothetical protein [Terrimicrobiaceae bacterium]